jgi:hypothetical protein
MKKTIFEVEIKNLINCNSQENNSNTPDFILARYLTACLDNFDKAVNQREQFYGRPNYRGEKPSSDTAKTDHLPATKQENHCIALREALDCLLRETVDMDLKHGIALSEGEENARQLALAALAEKAS